MSPIQEPPPLSPDLQAAMEDFRKICKESKSGSKAFEYGSQGYKDCIRHFLPSSSDVAQLAVKPGSAEDLSKMMKVLSARSTVPFAVKGGGHAMMPGASSTPGIMISMVNFDTVDYDPTTQLVKVGAGCLWDQVYAQMYQHRRNVVGGAASQGVGVAGWLLGAGYSLKSNRYGLGIDNVAAYEVVLPDGRMLVVSEEKEGRLFQALRGGGNNFGVVTNFILRTHPQSDSYGGSFVVPGDRVEEAKLAIAEFVENEQRKEAALVSAFRHRLINGQLEYLITFMCVYDSPKPTQPVFEQFRKLMESGTYFTLDPAGWRSGTGVLPRDATAVSDSLPVYRKLATVAPTLRAGAALTSSEDAYNVDPFREMDHTTAHTMFFNPYIFDTNAANGVDMEIFSRAAEPVMRMAASAVEQEEEAEAVSDDEDVGDLQEPQLESAEGDVPIDRPIQITKPTDSMGELKLRGRFGSIMVSKYTKPLLDKMAEEAEKAASHMKKRRGNLIMVDAWPFHAEVFKNSPPGAAWPHAPNAPFGPMLAYFLWEDEKDDEFWIMKLKGTLRRIRLVALDLGLTTSNPAYYNNLSLESVPAKSIYRDNMEWLMEVKEEYDPRDVMGRTGSVHKIPLPPC